MRLLFSGAGVIKGARILITGPPMSGKTLVAQTVMKQPSIKGSVVVNSVHALSVVPDSQTALVVADSRAVSLADLVHFDFVLQTSLSLERGHIYSWDLHREVVRVDRQKTH